jgi:hypothetical protein
MKEFMLLIRNQGEHLQDLSPDDHEQFLKACEVYINNLKQQGKLLSAQPMERQGKMISGTKGDWHDEPFNENKEVIVGYYHIRANDIDDAVAIARGNPEFEYSTTARIEVRPIKMKEVTTGFVYPNA